MSSAEFVHEVVIVNSVCLVSHKRDIGKQCRPRSDATGTTSFALSTGISVKDGNNKN